MNEILKDITSILEEGVKDSAYPGGQFALFMNNQIHLGHVGVRDYVDHIPTDGSEIYDVASVSKVISTATITHYLIHQGLFTLDSYVHEVLTDYPHKDLQIKDLLTHSSGLPADVTRAAKLRNREEVIKKLYDVSLLYEKNTRVVYSCTGFLILGLYLEKITGKPLNVLADEIVFRPLGMKDTSYLPDKTRAVRTELREDDVFNGYLKGQVHDEKAFALGNIAGNAGVFSTAYDIALYIKALLNNKFIFPQSVIDTMFKTWIEITVDGITYRRSLGWNKTANPNIIAHTGYTGCNLWIDREKKIGFVLLTNGVHPKREKNNVFPYRDRIYKLFHK